MFLEAVFGSRCRLSARRLQALERLARRRESRLRYQYRGESAATIANAGEHLEALTGIPCELVGDEDDGSPSFPRRLLHIAASGEVRDTATQTLRELLGASVG